MAILAVIALLGAYGWVINIVKMFGLSLGGELLARACGIFILPLGALLGFI